MAITKKLFDVTSSDGVHTLAGVVYVPDGRIKGFFHVVHGMTEYIGRYNRFMKEMAEEGYVTFGYDHLGHGETARDESELGYIAKRDGWKLLVRDVMVFSDAVRAVYGKKDLPYYLMGHSMGSFIARLAAQHHVKPDGLIVMGTGGANPAAGAGLALCAGIKCLRGDKHVSPLLDKIAFGSYNERFGGGTQEDPNPWLTTDVSVRERYNRDPFCTFRFTVSAMEDLIRLTKNANSGEWYKKLSVSIPILLVSGEEDPVGDYGEGVRAIEKKLKKEAFDVDCILYAGARHEILNDFTYTEVKRDILDFIAKH
jgi:alpha-beta hydrolase superfamily lysophospholipase